VLSTKTARLKEKIAKLEEEMQRPATHYVMLQRNLVYKGVTRGKRLAQLAANRSTER